MKKFFSFLAMSVIAMFAFQASAYSITLVFDNPAAIGSLKVYSDYSKEVVQTTYTPATSVVVNYDDNSKILDVVAAPGYALSECVFETTVKNTYFQNSYKGNHDIYLSSGYSGATYTYKTVNMDEARTNTATVTVTGDVSKVALQFSGTWLYANLIQGENTVKFMDSESTFAIGPKSYGQSLYKVSLNGVEQATTSSYSTNWSLTVKDGDNILIEADYPEVPCEVSFIFAEDDTKNYVTGVYLNQQPVENWQDGFTANGGDNLYFTVDSNLYKLNDFKVNGETKNLNGSYTTSVEGNALEFYFDVEPYGMCVANVTIDDPTRVLYRVGYSGDFQTISTSPFEVTVSEAIASYTPVYFKSTDDEKYYIASMVAGEYTISKNYDGTYSTNITDGMNITITTGEIVRDKTAYFYFHNPDAATNYSQSLYGYYFSNATTNGITLNAGYNVLTFGDVDNPWKFQVNGNLEYVEPKVKFYKNGELVSHTDTYNTIWEYSFENNDVYKVYISADDIEPLLLSFYMEDFSAAENQPEIYYDYVVKAEPMEAPSIELLEEGEEGEGSSASMTNYLDQVLPGTHVIIKPNGNSLDVTVNETKLEADEDGNYAFDVNEDTPIQVTSTSSRVNNINVDVNKGRVFNMQGVEVKNENLPAGLYIIDGRKVIIR